MSRNGKLFNKAGKDYRVTSPYGNRNITVQGKQVKGYHIGTDYAYPQGTELVVPLRAEVLHTAFGGDYGGQVFAYLPDLDITLHYAHMNVVSVRKGQSLSKGDVIGISGGRQGTDGAGLSSGPHLHIGAAVGKRTNTIKGTINKEWINIENLSFVVKKKKPLKDVAVAVRRGDYKNEPERSRLLKAEGYTSSEIKEIQKIVNELGKEPVKPAKDLNEAARKVARGDYKNEPERTRLLKKDGYTDAEIKKIQDIVNKGSAPSKPAKPAYKNEYGQNVKVGDVILFTELSTAVTGGHVYYASSTGRAQKISSDYITTSGGKRYYKAKVSKIYPKSRGYRNPYELVTGNGKSVLGRTRPAAFHKKA